MATEGPLGPSFGRRSWAVCGWAGIRLGEWISSLSEKADRQRGRYPIGGSWTTLAYSIQGAYRSGDRKAILKAVAELYDCDPTILARFVARDWDTFLKRPKAQGLT